MRTSLLIFALGVSVLLERGEAQPFSDSRQMAKSAIDELASTDNTIREQAIRSLLKDGPIRLEEIQQAHRTLEQILEMRTRLITPMRDARIGHRRSWQEIQEAIDFFLRHDGLKWVADALRTDDYMIRGLVAETLLNLSAKERDDNRLLLVHACLPLLKPDAEHFHVGGEVMLVIDGTRTKLTRLTAELIGFDLGSTATAPVDAVDVWRTQAARVAEAAERWLSKPHDSSR